MVAEALQISMERLGILRTGRSILASLAEAGQVQAEVVVMPVMSTSRATGSLP